MPAKGVADLKTIADADGIVGQALHGKVLAELSVNEAGPLQPFLPIAIRIELVDEDGALLTPVPGHVALAVSIEVQPADAAAARHRVLPDPGVHGAPLPVDVPRESDVYRDQSSHAASAPSSRSCRRPQSDSMSHLLVR